MRRSKDDYHAPEKLAGCVDHIEKAAKQHIRGLQQKKLNENTMRWKRSVIRQVSERQNTMTHNPTKVGLILDRRLKALHELNTVKKK